ncbi:MAG TPA: hypothetical protein VKZ54_13630, partial [Membranihabitans sp.]|nr:hypothetical protein [Membranihabitans sp.]
TTLIMESFVLASYSKYEELTQKADLHLHPPINKIGILDWKSYDKLVRIGRDYTDQVVTEDVRHQLMPYAHLDENPEDQS